MSTSKRWQTASAALGGLIYLSDLFPPRIRYGYVHRVTNAILSTSLPVVRGLERRQPEHRDVADNMPAQTTCVLASDRLDVGGIGSVIETLALGLPSRGIRGVVVCHGNGDRAFRLRNLGVEVVSVDGGEQAARAIATIGPDVIALHSAPRYLELSALASGAPTITVMHNTEIHFTSRRWRDFSDLLSGSFSGIAVSETVRRFHAAHVSNAARRKIEVVPNGAPHADIPTSAERARARALVSEKVGSDLGGATLFVCLARYDSQKNIAGTVASFVQSLPKAPNARLLFAGEPSDWAEVRRAQAIAAASDARDRVHLLGNSDPRIILAAADAFVLNSFFEGWPVAATEAAVLGLPLLMSDVGGGSELVARDPQRSVLIPNPSGDPATMSDAAVRRARRMSTHQSNRDEFAAAVARLALPEEVPRVSRDTGAARTAASEQEMIDGHARALIRAASAREGRSAPSE
jgi:glycosyltransferase involved in cell wall biosynthesis